MWAYAAQPGKWRLAIRIRALVCIGYTEKERISQLPRPLRSQIHESGMFSYYQTGIPQQSTSVLAS